MTGCTGIPQLSVSAFPAALQLLTHVNYGNDVFGTLRQQRLVNCSFLDELRH